MGKALADPGTASLAEAGKKKHVLGLDLLRAVAANFVLCFHLGFWIWRDPTAHESLPKAYIPLAPFFGKGWVGVEIFFVISGFVIAFSAQGVSPSRFLRHRWNRLFPAAVICSTLTGLVLLKFYPLPAVAAQFARSVIFWPVGPWIDGSYWTLPIEIAFYAFVWANLQVKAGRYLPHCTAILGCVSTVCCILVLLEPVFAPHWWMRWLDGAGFPPYACLLLIHGVFFAMGLFLFRLLMQGFTWRRATMLLICFFGCVAEIIWHDRGASAVTRSDHRALIPVSIWLGSLVILTLSVRFNTRLRVAVGDRGARILRKLGMSTYPLYLLHAKIGQVAIGALHRKVGYGAALASAAAAVWLIALFISKKLEPPLRKFLEETIWARLQATHPNAGPY